MKKLLIIFILFFVIKNSHGQILEYEWTRSFGGLGAERVFSVKADADGNVYSSGYFSNEIEVNISGEIESFSSMNKNSFIQKHDSNGDLVWFKTINGDEPNISCFFDFDSNGDIIVTGNFSGETDFDPGIGENIVSSVVEDSYILKLSPDGDFIWVKTYIGSNGRTLVCDDSGNIYLGGYYYNSASFSTENEYTSNGDLDSYVLKVNSNGDLLWTQSWGGTGLDQLNALGLDSQNNVYVTTFYESEIFLHGTEGAINDTYLGARDALLMVFDSDGAFLWNRTLGSNAGDEMYINIDFDEDDNIFICGMHSEGELTNSQGEVINVEYNGGFSDFFIEKLTPQGELLWIKGFGGSGIETSTDIAFHDDFIYMTGTYSDVVNFLPDEDGGVQYSNGLRDLFLLKLNSDGNPLWVKTNGGIADELGIYLHVSSNNKCYLSGAYKESIYLGDEEITSNGYIDVFVSKLVNCTSTGITITEGELETITSSCSIEVTAPIIATNDCGDYISGSTNVDFPITEPGLTEIIWEASIDGISVSKTQDVFIIDEEPPIPITENLSSLYIDCVADLDIAPIASDECVGIVYGVPNIDFPLDSLGEYLVEWTYDDGNGNTSSQLQSIIVKKFNTNMVLNPGGTLYVENSNNFDEFQWYDCATNLPIEGEEFYFYKPTENGEYKIRIGKDNCFLFLNCYTVNWLDIEDFDKNIQIFPNPTKDNTKIILDKVYNEIHVSITNILSEIVYSEKFYNCQQINVMLPEEKGLYFLRIQNSETKISTSQILKM